MGCDVIFHMKPPWWQTDIYLTQKRFKLTFLLN